MKPLHLLAALALTGITQLACAQAAPVSLLNAQYDSSIFFHEMFESGKNAFRPHYRPARPAAAGAESLSR